MAQGAVRWRLLCDDDFVAWVHNRTGLDVVHQSTDSLERLNRLWEQAGKP